MFRKGQLELIIVEDLILVLKEDEVFANHRRRYNAYGVHEYTLRGRVG